MSVVARPPAPSGKPPVESDAMAHYREEATPPVGRGEPLPGGFQAARDGCQQIGGPERLLQAGDRAELGRHGQEVGAAVRLRRDRPAGDHDDRNLRPVFANHPHGFKSIHSRHENVQEHRSKSPVWHSARPFRPSSAVTTLWPARSSNRRMVSWTAASSSTTSILAKVKCSPGGCWNQINGRLRVMPNRLVAATISSAGMWRPWRSDMDKMSDCPHVAGQTDDELRGCA